MILYKLDTKGKLRQIEIKVEGSELVQISGEVGGKLKEHRRPCKPKNVGRANETTAEQQALSEAASKISKKLDEGYFRTQNEAKNEVVEKPMLAKDAKTQMGKIAYPCFVQPKLDGMRCLNNVKYPMTSRANKEINTLPHLLSFAKEVGLKLDGELYAHGLTFQENISLIKKYRAGMSEQIKFHVYDIAMDASFEERHNMIIDTLAPYVNNEGVGELVELVPTYKCFSETDIKKYHQQFISEGYEGTIIRHTEDGYKFNGRSRALLKYKDFIDEAYTITDVVPLDGYPDMGQFECTMDSGYTFKAQAKGSFEYRREILANKQEYIGKTAEIRFFEFTDDGIPRFPVCYGIRLDK